MKYKHNIPENLMSNVKKSCHHTTSLPLIIATEDFVMCTFQCWYITKHRRQSLFENNDF